MLEHGVNQTQNKYNIICLSNQLWDFPNWTNKRHVMTRLAKLGHNILFVDPPINTGRVFFKQIKRGHWSAKRLLTQQKHDQSGANIFTPLNVVPFSKFTSLAHIKGISNIAKKTLDPKLPTILWVYHVQIAYLEKYIDLLNYDFLIYDCVDNYSAFPEESAFYKTSTSKDITEEQESYISKHADAIFASAPGLVSKLQKYSQDVYFTPNVGDYHKFKVVTELKKDQKTHVPQDLLNIPRPRIGFTGALDEYKFDRELFKKIAKDYPRYNFVLIGPLGLKDTEATLEDLGLEGVSNVHLMGSRDYQVIQKYFAGFDAFIIPYQLNDYTVGGCFPVKFHDAMAAGLPQVVTDLPAYYPFEDVCYISKTYDEFSQNIKVALDEDSKEKVLLRQNVAKQNNWDGKVQQMLDIIHQKISSK